MSTCAITPKVLKAMYDYNKEIPLIKYGERHSSNTYIWGGHRCRKMMQAIYTLAFTCLLRFDEVLQIQAHHIEIIDKDKGQIALHLLFRKTNQYGGKLCSSQMFI